MSEVKAPPEYNAQEVDPAKAELTVIECKCGYHMGIDSTFLEQDPTAFKGLDKHPRCPSCTQRINVRAVLDLPFDEENEVIYRAVGGSFLGETRWSGPHKSIEDALSEILFIPSKPWTELKVVKCRDIIMDHPIYGEYYAGFHQEVPVEQVHQVLNNLVLGRYEDAVYDLGQFGCLRDNWDEVYKHIEHIEKLLQPETLSIIKQ